MRDLRTGQDLWFVDAEPAARRAAEARVTEIEAQLTESRSRVSRDAPTKHRSWAHLAQSHHRYTLSRLPALTTKTQ